MMPNDAKQIQNALAFNNRMLSRLKDRFVSASGEKEPDYARPGRSMPAAGGFFPASPDGERGINGTRKAPLPGMCRKRKNHLPGTCLKRKKTRCS